MKLSNIISNIKYLKPTGYSNDSIIIEKIIEDSRLAKPGFMYISASQNIDKSVNFIKDAINNGASCIIIHSSLLPHIDKTMLGERNLYYCDDINIARSDISKNFYPNQPDNILAVTGTNGKTSTVHFIRQLLSLLGKTSSSIGTLGLYKGYNDRADDISNNLTTPGAIELHNIANKLHSENIDYLAIEASSHGLHQYRVSNLNISVAGFTNFSQDHLDYHKSMEEYFDAKMMLFRDILKPGYIAVLNKDIKEYNDILKICKSRNHKVFTYGKFGADINILDIKNTISGYDVSMEIFGIKYNVNIPVIGIFQVYNIALAILMVYGSTSIEIPRIIDCVNSLSAVPGRMEKVTTNYRNIYVDYAHKPLALESALNMLREHLNPNGKLITVFGCGGNRDSIKRPIMGEIASRLSDVAIITDDNPRDEDPAFIRSEIISGCKNNNYQEVADRAKAIQHAIDISKLEDIILIAGKGHEKYQIINEKILSFDDVEVAKTYSK